MNIKKQPLGLLIQIDPDTGQFIEGALHFTVQIDGSGSRHEQWWNKITDSERKSIQKLIDSAVKGILG